MTAVTGEETAEVLSPQPVADVPAVETAAGRAAQPGPGPGRAGRVRRVAEVASLTAALLDKPGSLAHSQPPTFRQARDRHHECAGHFNAPVLRWARLAWGYVHLLFVKTVLNGTEWVTESPLRLLVTCLLSAGAWFFSTH